MTRILKAPGLEFCRITCAVVSEPKIFCSDQCSEECSMNKLRVSIHRQVFGPSKDSSVLFQLTRREQLMSPECSIHQVSSFSKMLVVRWTNQKYSVLISFLQSGQRIDSERISRDACFLLSRTHYCGSS